MLGVKHWVTLDHELIGVPNGKHSETRKTKVRDGRHVSMPAYKSILIVISRNFSAASAPILDRKWIVGSIYLHNCTMSSQLSPQLTVSPITSVRVGYYFTGASIPNFISSVVLSSAQGNNQVFTDHKTFQSPKKKVLLLAIPAMFFWDDFRKNDSKCIIKKWILLRNVSFAWLE